MYDNGLLKYYKDCSHKNGFLKASKLLSADQRLTCTLIDDYEIDGKNYYFKRSLQNKKEKMYGRDAEILLSQIYNKAGIKSAVYLPIEYNKLAFLVSNDIERNNVVLGQKYVNKNLDVRFKDGIPFLDKTYTKLASTYFTKHALEQQTKLGILDIASYNSDRHLSNLFYKIKRKEDNENEERMRNRVSLGRTIVNHFSNMKGYEIITDVQAIDFETSGENIINPDCADVLYLNNFGEDKSRGELLYELSNNEVLGSIINKDSLAEEIGNLNPQAVAKEINETIGYKVDSKFVDRVSESFEETADILKL